MVNVSDDFPPQYTKDTKLERSKKRRRSRRVKRKDLEELISLLVKAAHVARDKGFYTASPEAIRCVEILRHMRSLPLTPRIITQADALRPLQLLSTNGNPKIRSESRCVLDHWRQILQTKSD